MKTLRQLNQLPVRQVVPAHGPVMGKEIIDANQRYVEELYEAVRARKRSGARRVDIDLPVEAFVGDGVEVDADLPRHAPRERGVGLRRRLTRAGLDRATAPTGQISPIGPQ